MTISTSKETKNLTPEQRKAIKKVSKNGIYLKQLSEEQRNDKTIVVEAIKNNRTSIFYASGILKRDSDVIFIYCLDGDEGEEVFSLKYLAGYIDVAFEKSAESEIQQVVNDLHSVLSKKDTSFFDASIDRLDQNDFQVHEKFKQADLDKSKDYAEYKQSSKDGLSYIIKILPESILKRNLKSTRIQSMLTDELTRRRTISIAQNATLKRKGQRKILAKP